MELRHLRQFVAVAEESSFTRAAERLHIAQPALSVQIRRLERDLGVELFDRSRRTIRLTEGGALLLTDARRILALVDESADVVRRIGSGAVGNLSIGFIPSAANVALPPILRAFAATHPDVVLHLREMAPDDLLRSLRERRLDICFLYQPFGDPSLQQAVVTREPFVAALPADHPLARHRTVDVRSLRNDSFILPARHGMPGLHAQVHDICRTAGFSPKAVQEGVWLVQTAVGLVAAGIGVALVPSSAEALGRRGVVYRPLRGRAPHEVSLAAAWRREDPTAVLRVFIEELPVPPAMS